MRPSSAPAAWLLALVATLAVAQPASRQPSGGPVALRAFDVSDRKPAVAGQARGCGVRSEERRLVRLVTGNHRIGGEEHLPAGHGQRVRDAKQGPDGMLYVVTDASSGELWRIVPRR